MRVEALLLEVSKVFRNYGCNHINKMRLGFVIF